ncbi:MAG: NAD-dependent epimerase/dehydratase family protein [FCB group bacterium]|nr:NAD-dependent epimerase/dehydratase family protein [FCB group bacterium]
MLVTGATGFIGRQLLVALRDAGIGVAAAVRGRPIAGIRNIRFDLREPDRLSPDDLRGFDCVYHLAARVHVMQPGPGEDAAFQLQNVRATRSLAECAARAGVRRLVYLSSIKVNGEHTSDRPFRAHDAPAPQDAYGRSKRDAENALFDVAATTALEVVCIRPPLVYGPGVRANFRRLISLVDCGWPLPFRGVNNRRSLISVWNLADLLVLAGSSECAAGRVFLAADGEDVSTPDLMNLIASALGRPRARLVAAPPALLKVIALVVGKSAEASRLLDSLQVDATETREAIGWVPAVSMRDGVFRTVSWFKEPNGAVT